MATSNRIFVSGLNGLGKFGNMRDIFMAAAYAQLGDRRKANQLAAGIIPRSSKLVEPYGGSEKTRWRAYLDSLVPYRNADDKEHFMEGLSKAGLPV